MGGGDRGQAMQVAVGGRLWARMLMVVSCLFLREQGSEDRTIMTLYRSSLLRIRQSFI
jgi:hypothetical protein